MRYEDIQSLAEHVKTLTRIVVHESNDREVTILVGKYKGREAVIAGVVPCAVEGFLYLLMVQRRVGGDLNSDDDSRAWHPRGHWEYL